MLSPSIFTALRGPVLARERVPPPARGADAAGIAGRVVTRDRVAAPCRRSRWPEECA